MMPPRENLLAALPIALAVLGTAALFALPPKGEDVRERAAQETRRDLGAAQACGGQPFTWENEYTLVCHRERPEPAPEPLSRLL